MTVSDSAAAALAGAAVVEDVVSGAAAAGVAADSGPLADDSAVCVGRLPVVFGLFLNKKYWLTSNSAKTAIITGSMRL